MSDKAAQTAPTATKAQDAGAGATDDTKSVMSDTSTLADSKQSPPASPKGTKSSSTSKVDAKLDSASAFSKEAKKKGWAAPTAARPSLG